jgi:hypothetical protein
MQLSPKKLDIQKANEIGNSNNGGILGPIRKRRSHYPELLAKTYNVKSGYKPEKVVSDSNLIPAFLNQFNQPPPQDIRYKCTRTYLVGSTSKSEYYKAVTCGKDWCPDCGANLSTTHRRRFNDLILPRFKALQEMGLSIGYLVITIPKSLRERFTTQEALTDFRNYWRRKLKRENKALGVMRFHWAGEDGHTWHPHLNVLMPSGWITPETLNEWKKELGHWFKEYLNLPECNYWDVEKKEMVSDFPPANIYYHYLKPKEEFAEGKLFHWVKYIFRSTQTRYNKKTAGIIKGYRNTSIFGKKDLWPKKGIDETAMISQARKGFEIDETTGEAEKIVWLKRWNENTEKFVPQVLPLSVHDLVKMDQIGAGFWKRTRDIIPDNYKPPQFFGPKLPKHYKFKAIRSGPQLIENIFCPF